MRPETPDVKAVFDAAAEIPDPAARQAYLAAACAGAPDVRREVDELLSAYAAAGSFLDAPAVAPPDTASLPDADPGPLPEAGAVIAGRYKLLQVLGEGAMGTVFMADQTQPVKRRVAVKVIKAGMDTARVLAHFEAERQALALMDHPNIAKVLDAGTTEADRPFFVMELVKGIPLTRFCDQHRLAVPDRLHLLIQVCSAVQHAHQKGVIHRDLKPSNILVESHDGQPVPKVIDFGLAKATGDALLTERTLFTAFGAVAGTPLYMAPEQAAFNARDVDTRADVYSLGVILYELLTGTTPIARETFRGAAVDEMLRVIREQDPPTPSSRLGTADALPSVAANRQTEPAQLGRFLRGELDWIVMKALAKERDGRYESPTAFAQDVERFLNHEPVSAGPPTARYRLRKFLRRYRGPVAAGAALAALLVLGTVGTSIGLAWALRAERTATRAAESEGRERQEAETQRDRARSAEERAREEAVVAQAVTDFLRDDLLAQADPAKNPRGRKVTVEDVLRLATARLDGRFPDQPRVEAAIRQTIGDTYYTLGDYQAAQEQMGRALAVRRRVLGEEHPDTLGTMSNLGLVYQFQGRFREAEPLLADALRVSRRALGEEHPDTLIFMNNLAVYHHFRGEYAQAEPLYLRALEVRRRVLPPDHPHTLITTGNLGLVYRDWRQYEKAEPFLKAALDGQRRVHPEDHPEALVALNNLAVLYHSQGRAEEAEPLYQRILELRVRVLGEDHPHTLTAMSNLGILYRDLGRLPEAETLLAKAVAVGRRVSEREPQTLTLMNNLALVRHSQGRKAEAESLLGTVLTLRRQVLGDNHPLTFETVVNLAEMYQADGRVRDAEPLYREALATARARDGPESASAAGLLANLGLNLLHQQRYAEAEPVLRECLAIRERQAPDDWRTFNTRSLLGGALLGQKKYADARPLLAAGYQGLARREQALPAPARARLPEAADRLVELYTALAKPDEAARWRAERAKYRPPPPEERGPPPREVK